MQARCTRSTFFPTLGGENASQERYNDSGSRGEMQGAHRPSLSIHHRFCSSILVALIIQVCSTSVPLAFDQTSAMQLPTFDLNYQSRSYQGQIEHDYAQCIRPAIDYASTR